MIFGAGESFGEVRDARKGGALKPGADACLEDGKGVDIPVPFLEGKMLEGCDWVGWPVEAYYIKCWII